MPCTSSDDSLLSLLNSQEDIEALNESIIETDELPDGIFYTGNAILKVSVQKEKSLKITRNGRKTIGWLNKINSV